MGSIVYSARLTCAGESQGADVNRVVVVLGDDSDCVMLVLNTRDYLAEVDLPPFEVGKHYRVTVIEEHPPVPY